jgi:3-hydroxyanthranilate 3,4-dioxygenase
MARKKTFQTFREARKLGPYDERPMLPDEIDVQLHLSRNDRPQPFFLICGKDTLIARMSGRGRVEFKGTDVGAFALEPGDYVYVPAGAPHRLVPEGECVDLRYKAQNAGLEGVAWYCPECEREIHREVWDTSETITQEAYSTACERFNADPKLRACRACGAMHPPLDLFGFNWRAIAEEIRADRSN